MLENSLNPIKEDEEEAAASYDKESGFDSQRM